MNLQQDPKAQKGELGELGKVCWCTPGATDSEKLTGSSQNPKHSALKNSLQETQSSLI